MNRMNASNTIVMDRGLEDSGPLEETADSWELTDFGRIAVL